LLDEELRAAYKKALSGHDVFVNADAFVRVYRHAHFHLPVPKFWRNLRERLT
jgi:hypothetical protein